MILRVVLPLLVVVVLIGGIYALYVIGRARGRSTHVGGTGPLAFVGGLGWAVAIAVVGGLAASTSSFGIPPGQSAAHGYGGAFGIVLAIVGALLALPIGFVIVKAGVRSGEDATPP